MGVQRVAGGRRLVVVNKLNGCTILVVGQLSLIAPATASHWVVLLLTAIRAAAKSAHRCDAHPSAAPLCVPTTARARPAISAPISPRLPPMVDHHLAAATAAADTAVATTMAERPRPHHHEQRPTPPLAPPISRSATPGTPEGSTRSINVLLEAAHEQLEHLKLDIAAATTTATTSAITRTDAHTDTAPYDASPTANDVSPAAAVTESAPVLAASPPPRHRRTSTLGSAVTDDWTVQSPPTATSIPTPTNSTPPPPEDREEPEAEPEAEAETKAPSASADKPPTRPSSARRGRAAPRATRGDSAPVPTADELSAVPRRSATTGHSGKGTNGRTRRRTRTRGGSGTRGSVQTPGCVTSSASDDFEDEPSPLASPAALDAHRAALGALRRAERGCRRAQALAAADAAPREQRRAWAAVNTYHREAVSAAAHVRLWAAAYEPAVSDPDVAHGNAALPPYHAPVLFPTARRARRAKALERARAASQHLAQRQERMLHYLQLAATTSPILNASKTPASAPPTMNASANTNTNANASLAQRPRSSSFA